MVPYKTLSSDSVIALPKTNSRMFFNQCTELINDCFISFRLLFILLCTSRQPYCFTCLTLAYPLFFNHVLSQATFFIRRYSFFATASFKASCTRLKLAYIRFKRLFSSSSSLTLLSSFTSNPA